MSLDEPGSPEYWKRKAHVRQAIIEQLKAQLHPDQTPARLQRNAKWQKIAERRIGIIDEQRDRMNVMEARIAELEEKLAHQDTVEATK